MQPAMRPVSRTPELLPDPLVAWLIDPRSGPAARPLKDPLSRLSTSPAGPVADRPHRSPEDLNCPHCHSARLHKWGWTGGRRQRRYRCKACRRTFTGRTGTPLAWTRYPEKWPNLGRCLVEGLTVRQSGAALGVHFTTAFRWRHRLLTSLRLQNRDLLWQITKAAVQGDLSYHRRLREWLGRFRGISPRYVTNYQVWFAFLEAGAGQGWTVRQGTGEPQEQAGRDKREELEERLCRVLQERGPRQQAPWITWRRSDERGSRKRRRAAKLGWLRRRRGGRPAGRSCGRRVLPGSWQRWWTSGRFRLAAGGRLPEAATEG